MQRCLQLCDAQHREDVDLLGLHEYTKMLQGLEHFYYRERLGEPGEEKALGRPKSPF